MVPLPPQMEFDLHMNAKYNRCLVIPNCSGEHEREHEHEHEKGFDFISFYEFFNDLEERLLDEVSDNDIDNDASSSSSCNSSASTPTPTLAMMLPLQEILREMDTETLKNLFDTNVLAKPKE